MGDLVASEAEAVGDALDEEVVRIGFYSYGELTPIIVSFVTVAVLSAQWPLTPLFFGTS